MPLDHYVSQVHLKNFNSVALGELMYAIRKSDLKKFVTKAQHARPLVSCDFIGPFGLLPSGPSCLILLRSGELGGKVGGNSLRSSVWIAHCSQRGGTTI
jgi:hypothetical protein